MPWEGEGELSGAVGGDGQNATCAVETLVDMRTGKEATVGEHAVVRLRGRDWAVGSVPVHPGPGGHGLVLGRTLERGAGPKPKWRLTTGWGTGWARWTAGWATGWHPSLELLEGQKGPLGLGSTPSNPGRAWGKNGGIPGALGP